MSGPSIYNTVPRQPNKLICIHSKHRFQYGRFVFFNLSLYSCIYIDGSVYQIDSIDYIDGNNGRGSSWSNTTRQQQWQWQRLRQQQYCICIGKRGCIRLYWCFIDGLTSHNVIQLSGKSCHIFLFDFTDSKWFGLTDAKCLTCNTSTLLYHQ